MAFRLCKSCSTIIEDANQCIRCGSDDLKIFDVLVSLKGASYKFDQDKKNKDVWFATAPGKSYKLEVAKRNSDGTVAKVVCDCVGYTYRGRCKHCIALADHLNAGRKSISESFKLAKKRHPRSDVKKLVKILDKGILKGIKYAAAGSYRREKRDSKDLDILVEGFKKSVIEKRLKSTYPGGDEKRPGDKVAPAGKKSGKHILRWYAPIGDSGGEISLDFHFIIKPEFEPALLFFTGSKEFNLKMRGEAKRQGYALNRYGLWDAKNRDKLIARTEKEIFNALGMPFVAPNRR